MPTLGWPFLIARGRHTDYRVVSAPDFLVQAHAYGVLSDSLRVAAVRDGDVRSVGIGSPAGELTATYTSERLEGVDPASTGGERWPTDEHGRPLQVLYGVVTRGSPNGPVDARDLDAARREAIAGFRRFLAGEAGFTVDTTRGFELRSMTTAPAASSVSAPPAPPSSPPPDLRPSRGALAAWIAAGAVAALIAAVAAWVLPVKPVVVTADITPPPQPVTCTEPIALTATITADRATKVVYHWESLPSRRAYPRRSLKVAGERAREVRLNADPPVATTGGQPTSVTYALVIEAPAAPTARVTLTCEQSSAPDPRPLPAAPQPAPPAAAGAR